MSRFVLTMELTCASICVSQIVTRWLEGGVSELTVAERLIKARGNKRREDVATAVGVSVSAIAMYENGERVPRDETKIKLADYYKTTVQELFF